MILIAAIVTVLCSTIVSGDCPAQGNQGHLPAGIRYQPINIDKVTDPTTRTAVQNYLDNVHIEVSQDYLAISCKEIAELKPHYDSGYYWIQGVSGAVGVYCEMGNNRFGQSGGWMRISNVEMRNNDSQCPPGLVYNITEGRRLCRKPSLAPGCSSTTFVTLGTKYTKVCGKVIGYQYWGTNGFGPSRGTPGINQSYVDGVSITHGSPRQHVWTLAAALDETFTYNSDCPCIKSSHFFDGVIPSFIGNDYYCETGSRTRSQNRYYFDDPLWDGKGCGPGNTCRNRGGPWFCKQLPQPTQDDIEMRVCTNNPNPDEDVVLEQIELYIQ